MVPAGKLVGGKGSATSRPADSATAAAESRLKETIRLQIVAAAHVQVIDRHVARIRAGRFFIMTLSVFPLNGVFDQCRQTQASTGRNRFSSPCEIRRR